MFTFDKKIYFFFFTKGKTLYITLDVVNFDQYLLRIYMKRMKLRRS